MNKTSVKIIGSSILLGGSFWFIDAIYVYLRFKEELRFLIFQTPLSFIDSLTLNNISPHNFFIRLSVMSLCLLSGLLVTFLFNQRIKAEEKLKKSHDTLEKRVSERTEELLKINQKLFEEIKIREKTEKKLEVSKGAAEAASQSKSQFLANMSHEIRTPISGILGMIEMTLDLNASPDIEQNLRLIKTSSNSLLNIINDILDISKIETGKLDLTNERFNLFDVIRKNTNIFSQMAHEKGLNLDIQILPNVPEYIKGDSERLGQIIRNLINNAIKFTEKGEIVITITCISNNNSSDKILFSVKDTGIGIPEKKFPKIFEKFAQLDNSYSKKYAGTGLGLAISKELVELMDGSIWLESEVGKGSSFYFTIKFDISEGEPDVFEKEKIRQAPIALTKRSLIILLAEDDDLHRQTMTYFLKREGHIVVSTTSGHEVIKKLEAGTFDIVLMDVQMPEMDGVEATKQIRSSKLGKYDPKIPIIALTAYAMEGDREKFLEAGMNDYITKPADIESLLLKMNRLVVHDECLFGKNQSANTTISLDALSEELNTDEYITDIQRFVKNTQDDIEFMRKVLLSFPKNAQDRLDLVEKAITDQDTDQIAKTIHRFLGLFSLIFIRSVTKNSQELQKAARSGNLKKCNELFSELQQKMKHILNYIKSIQV
ncbi:MAG: response regulator [Desulfobacterales bacterium]|nr:response regulator [Desulfobacterales bacterium]